MLASSGERARGAAAGWRVITFGIDDHAEASDEELSQTSTERGTALSAWVRRGRHGATLV